LAMKAPGSRNNWCFRNCGFRKLPWHPLASPQMSGPLFLVVGRDTESCLDDPSHLEIFAGEREDSFFSNDLRRIALVYFTTSFVKKFMIFVHKEIVFC
jgi:hypothetical protein